MTNNKSYTSATKSDRPSVVRWLTGALVGLLFGGLALRTLRLSWQPLWWDEGYSVYFATESLTHMLWLTAGDIHPPLYYALLHGWITLLGGPEPLVLRTFSALVGLAALPTFYWLAQTFFPGQKRTPLLAVILLIGSPIHIFYSQEVRMYGLAMLWGMAATGCFWKLLKAHAISLDAQTGHGQSATHAGDRTQAAHTQAARVHAARYWIGYLLFATLTLYTLYYAAFLFAAHLLWALWHCKERPLPWRFRQYMAILGADFRVACWPPLSALLLAGLLYVPWIIYAGLQLQRYVSDKVLADNDASIGLWRYLFQHLTAFTGGHLIAQDPWLMGLRYVGLVGLLILLVGGLYQRGRASSQSLHSAKLTSEPLAVPSSAAPSSAATMDSIAAGALLCFLIIPVAISFLINLFLPFAPEGGERLLLFVLPYFLLLIARAVGKNWHGGLGILALLLLLTSALAGVFTFYSTPRYSQRDYRPLVGQMLQQGADGDTLLAIFPWQVGYWRAYIAHPLRTLGMSDNATTADSSLGPQPLLIGQGAIEWNAQVEQQIQDALAQGTLWFPEPLALGSTLPMQIETYLWEQGQGVTPEALIRTVNLENRWANPTSRLTAWHWLPQPTLQAVDVDFGALRLTAAGVGPEHTASANRPVAINLFWQLAPDAAGRDYQATLRLHDAHGQVWVSRDLPVQASGAQSTAPPSGAERQDADFTLSGTIEVLTGLLIPAGLPPGAYQLLLGVRPVEGSQSGVDATNVVPADQAAPLLLPAGQETPFFTIGNLQIELPASPLPAFRLPIQQMLDPVVQRGSVAFLGYAGLDDQTSFLAGAELEMTLFLQNRPVDPSGQAMTTESEQLLYVSVLDAGGAGMAGWEGWPLPDYPMARWQAGALARLPIQFALPATLPSGPYRVVAGLLDAATGVKSEPVPLGETQIRQRLASFDAPNAAHMLGAPVQFGAHAQLIGYDVQVVGTTDAPQIELRLHWRALQPLLPAHNIFVHLVDEGGQILAQSDGPPLSLRPNGQTESAPTGSWQPSEYLTTHQLITLPPAMQNAFELDAATGALSHMGQPLHLRVGLYIPPAGQRLPTSIDGQATGDAAALP